jgi:hypothetical protein
VRVREKQKERKKERKKEREDIERKCIGRKIS